MKKLLPTLFALLSLCISVEPISLCADSIQYDMNYLNHLNYFWSGDEEHLYFNINLANDLQFKACYYTMSIENGQCCEITFYPLEGISILSSEGYSLQKICMIVEVKNGYEPNVVMYRVILKSSYLNENEEGNHTEFTQQFVRKGTVKNPIIDLTQDPLFFTINDKLNHGIISFKNSFPYSNM
jgi:hypothetical protein